MASTLVVISRVVRAFLTAGVIAALRVPRTLDSPAVTEDRSMKKKAATRVFSAGDFSAGTVWLGFLSNIGTASSRRNRGGRSCPRHCDGQL